jgi:hypothetical protein
MHTPIFAFDLMPDKTHREWETLNPEPFSPLHVESLCSPNYKKLIHKGAFVQ